MGDRVTRVFGAGVTMPMVVVKVAGGLITCNALEGGSPVLGPGAELWTFDAETGAEIDHDLRWGPQYGRTGTYLVRPAF